MGSTVHLSTVKEIVNLKELKAGEEVILSYIDVSKPYALRQADLKQRFLFSCQCPSMSQQRARNAR